MFLEKDHSFIKYEKTDDILCDMRNIIETSQQQAFQAVNFALVQRNWLIGYRIAEEELKGENRAEYGMNMIKQLSKKLSDLYGKGFTKTNLYSFYSFYKTFPEDFPLTEWKICSVAFLDSLPCTIASARSKSP